MVREGVGQTQCKETSGQRFNGTQEAWPQERVPRQDRREYWLRSLPAHLSLELLLPYQLNQALCRILRFQGNSGECGDRGPPTIPAERGLRVGARLQLYS